LRKYYANLVSIELGNGGIKRPAADNDDEDEEEKPAKKPAKKQKK